MDFDVLAFIGRFQPFHIGHQAVIDTALTRAKKVAVVIGGHDQPRSTRDPFTTSERIAMVTAVYPDEVAAGRIGFVPQVNHRYNDQRWIAGVQTGVTTIANRPFTPDPVKIGLIGHSKDATSYYLKSFPTWGSVEADNVGGINATDIRRGFFDGSGKIENLSAPVTDWLRDFQKSPAYTHVAQEQEFIRTYKKQFEDLPYPPTFHTVDAVVVQSGHILLIERGAMPGKGLWALPGGFLNPEETLRQGALRELREETRIALSDETLNRCIRSWRTFDDPNRSDRGRTLTTAFYVELRPDTELTKVKGSDDAAKARWVPLSAITRSVMFEDHYDIIQTMVAI